MNLSQLCTGYLKYMTSVGVRFTVASYYCSTDPLSDTIFKIFKMTFYTVETFHEESFFYLDCKKFCVVQNFFPIATMLHKINDKKNLFRLLSPAPSMRPS